MKSTITKKQRCTIVATVAAIALVAVCLYFYNPADNHIEGMPEYPQGYVQTYCEAGECAVKYDSDGAGHVSVDTCLIPANINHSRIPNFVKR